MSRLYQGNENWVFESDNGIEYSIYKGMGDGKAKQVNSDIFFIILDEYWEDDVSTEFIGWGYGADFIGEDEEYTDIVKGMVYDFEKSHPLIVQELGKARPFADDVETLYDFFYLNRTEFLERYIDIREIDEYQKEVTILLKDWADFRRELEEKVSETLIKNMSNICNKTTDFYELCNKVNNFSV